MPGVLLVGGSFNPIHHGHLIIARAAAEQLRIARVVLIPGAMPPHKQGLQLAPAAERLEMCRLAVQGDALMTVSDCELNRDGPSYTLHTVRHFAAQMRNTRIYWLIGSDSLNELHTWHQVQALASECTLVTAMRPGFPGDVSRLEPLISPEQLARIRDHFVRTPLIEISATEIRLRAGAGRSITYLVPERVADYIESRRLYATGKS